jgi:chemotaxis methyl-accepting protein methylase
MYIAHFHKIEPRTTAPVLVAEREIWRELVEERCGTYFADGRFHVLDSRIDERMRIVGEPDKQRYYKRVVSDREEWSHLLVSLLNGDTAFFRHPDSFHALRQVVFPNQRPQAIWCAGCSTGEEVYSIASLALEHGLDPVRVLGSDLNPSALAKAAAGVYPAASEAVRGFHRTAHGMEPGAALRSAVSFEQCNLLDVESYPANQDLIWCQNVLIYCRDPLRARIVAGFEKSLRPGGYLLLSPVDAMSVRPTSLMRVRKGNVPLFRKR